MRPTPSRLLAGGVVVLVLAALVTVLLVGREPEDLPPGTPEAAVQEYLDAVLDGDDEAAAALFTPTNPCTVLDLENAWVDEDVRVTLDDVRVDGKAARVEVTVASSGGGLVPDAWSEEQTFRLSEIDGDWLISGVPWPLFECGASFR